MSGVRRRRPGVGQSSFSIWDTTHDLRSVRCIGQSIGKPNPSLERPTERALAHRFASRRRPHRGGHAQPRRRRLDRHAGQRPSFDPHPHEPRRSRADAASRRRRGARRAQRAAPVALGKTPPSVGRAPSGQHSTQRRCALVRAPKARSHGLSPEPTTSPKESSPPANTTRSPPPFTPTTTSSSAAGPAVERRPSPTPF